MSNQLKKSWSGTLKLGFVTQAVAVYAAADSKAAKVAFNQMCGCCGGRTNNVTVCRKCDDTKALGSADIRKGYEYEKGKWVQVTEEELKSCQVENTKTIDLKEFVPLTELSPLMVVESAFIAPLLSEMSEAYVLIREALKDMVGIGTLCNGNKEKLIAIVASGRGLVMHTLRHASEIRDVMNVPTLDKLPETADAATVGMMRTLMTSMQREKLDLEKYPNRYVENVHKLIRTKVEGTAVEAATEIKKPIQMDLEAMLKASLMAAQAQMETI